MIAMKRHGKRERGVAVILAALWLGAITAVAAIAVEVARLTHVATEVQIAADAAALAAAKNLFGGGDQTSATTAGQTVAGKNQADGRLPAPGDVNIEFGKYGVAAGWGSSGDPAVRATVTMTNVKYIMASMLGLGNTGSVQKRAVAMYGCKESGHATAPFTLADCQLAQYTNGQQCSVNNPTLITTTNNTMCWIANNSNDADYLPPVPGCGNGSAPPFSLGDTVQATNGNVIPVYRDIQRCVGSTCVFPGQTGPGVHDFVIPIIPCPIANCNAGTSIEHIVGFATIHISCPGDVVCPNCNIPGPSSPGVGIQPSPSVTFSQICNNNADGGGGDTGGTECFGSGSVKLVDDRRGT